LTLKKNEAVKSLLVETGLSNYMAETVVTVLVDREFIPEDIPTLTQAEEFAQDAKKWLGDEMSAKAAYHFASGWSTDSWATVLSRSLQNDSPALRNVFLATVILAKEAGVEL
jgi:hypothetical protein